MVTKKKTVSGGKMSKENFPKEIASNRQIKQPAVVEKKDLVNKMKLKPEKKGK